MEYSLRYFDAELRSAVEAATEEVRRAAGTEVSIDDLVRSLAQQGAFDRTLGVTGIDDALLVAIPPRSTGFFQRFRRSPAPTLSRRLRDTLDETRFHARHADATAADTMHFARALAWRDDEGGARILVEVGFDAGTLESLISGPELAKPTAQPEPRREVRTDGYTVTQLWAAIEQMIELETCWHVDDWFAPGATVEEIAALEDVIGAELPDDVQESLRCHNGSVAPIHDVYELLSCDSIASEWRLVRDDEANGWHDDYAPDDIDAHQGVQRRFSSEGWIPILQMAGKTEYICCDLAPDAGGAVGQMVTYAMDDFDRHILFGSMREYLSWLLNQLANSTDSDTELIVDPRWT